MIVCCKRRRSEKFAGKIVHKILRGFLGLRGFFGIELFSRVNGYKFWVLGTKIYVYIFVNNFCFFIISTKK
jgi:hypothetical protein